MGRKYNVFGIGKNQYGEFALKHKRKITKKWTELKDFALHIQSLKDVYCGQGRFLIMNEHHRIYCCGKNDRQELGLSLDNKPTINKFKRLKQLETSTYDPADDYISLISNGKHSKHSFLKTKSCSYYGIGVNHYAQLGNGMKTYDLLKTPTQLHEVEDVFNGIHIKQIECGMLHSLFLTNNGNVYSCGSNGLGQLGIIKTNKSNFDEYQLTPTKVPFLYDITSICCGNDHNLCLNKEQKLWVFGSNFNHQLGLEESSNLENGRMIARNSEFIDVPIMHSFFKNERVKSMSCGAANSCIISMNGDLYTFGDNSWSQSIGKYAESRKHIKYPQLLQSFDAYSDLKFIDSDLGHSHSLFLTNNNKLYSVGNNNHCQCTKSTRNDIISWPYLVTRKEIGIDENHMIERVIAGWLSTFIFTLHSS